jgi:peptidoglycan/LPS O-acetylase OafA/YrhL
LTQTAPRAHGLDTLRSVAIVAVILFHVHDFHGDGTLPASVASVANLGWMGVDLFFVLSGYLIASQFLKPYLVGHRPGLWEFYRNRIFRVLPAYGTVLALYYAWPLWRESHNLPPLWELITFTQNLFANISLDHAFSHVWSLCVEEHFYLLFPLIVLPMMLKPSLNKTVAVIAGLVLLGMSIRGLFLFHLLRPLADSGESFGSAYMSRIYYPTYSRLDGLLAGVALGLMRTFRPAGWRALTRRGHSLLAAGVCLVGFSVYLFWDRFESVRGASALGIVVGPPVLSLGLGCLVASAVSSNGWLRVQIPGARLVATLAYSLYLTHKELIHLVDLWFPSIAEGAMYRWLGVYAVCCLAAATVLYLCVEQPFLRLRDKRRSRTQIGRGAGLSSYSSNQQEQNEGARQKVL